VKRLLLTAIAAALLALLSTSSLGCRPDETIPDDGDSTEVIVEDESLAVGVWEPDTMATYMEELAAHQEQLQDVFFEYDSNDLTAEAMDALMFDASYIMSNHGFRVLLEGHCDERGTIDYNLALGERRAQAVLDYLVNYGISASRLETVSYGKERPFAYGSDESAWAQNRRVHFRVLPES
jgi:peptidoglycan-associated lipoprotein